MDQFPEVRWTGWFTAGGKASNGLFFLICSVRGIVVKMELSSDLDPLLARHGCACAFRERVQRKVVDTNQRRLPITELLEGMMVE